MFCDACGTQFQAGQRVCAACGKMLSGFGSTPAGADGRVSRHVQLVGILTIVGASIGLTWGLTFVHLWRVPMHWGGHRVFAMFPFSFGGWIVTCAVLGLIGGVGLLQRQPWARTLALVMNGLALVYVPFGTALGIYAPWVLLPMESAREYRQMARAA